MTDHQREIRTCRLRELFAEMNDDEQEIVLAVAEKTMGRGRTEYGPAHVDDSRNDAAETYEEVSDALWYAAKGLVRMKRSV